MKKYRIISAILCISPLIYSIIIIASLYVKSLKNIAFSIYGLGIIPASGIGIASLVMWQCYLDSTDESAKSNPKYDALGWLIRILTLLAVPFAFIEFIGYHF